MKQRLRIYTLAICALVLLGYVSDMVSAGVCERWIARRVAYDLFQGRDFYVLAAKSDGLIPISGESLKIFMSVGAKVRPYNQTTADFEGFPWGDVHRASVRYPFLVSVRWGGVEAPLSGLGGTQIFLCLFGYVIPLNEGEDWAA